MVPQSTYNGPGDSAEWIEELPTAVNPPQPTLANFGIGDVHQHERHDDDPQRSPGLPHDRHGRRRGHARSPGRAPSPNNSFTDHLRDDPRTATGWSAPTAASSPSGRRSSTGRPGACSSSGRSSGSCPRPIAAATGSTRPTVASSPTGTPSSTGRYPASGSIRRARAANSLNAPIVGMVPSNDDNGYFMVASDGGVFAFGDAHFAGSCPGIGGCSGSAVAVMPDASGNGYWLVTVDREHLHVRRRALLRRPRPRHRHLGRGHPRRRGLLGPARQRPGPATTATPATTAHRPRRTSSASMRPRPSSARRTAAATGSRRPSAPSSTSVTHPTTGAWPGPT